MERRTILALYHSDDDVDYQLEGTKAQGYVEVIFNSLGLVMEIYDLKMGPPDYSKYPDIRGIFSWIEGSYEVPDPVGVLQGLIDQIDKGVYFVDVGGLDFAHVAPDKIREVSLLKRTLYEKLGLYKSGSWIATDYRIQITDQDPLMVGFEHALSGYFAPYEKIKITDTASKSYLDVEVKGIDNSASSLVVLSPKGGVVVPGWFLFRQQAKDKLFVQWFVNPFLYFGQAFQTDGMPKFDTTTLAGRRIYYSHIDGDGWYNRTSVPPYVHEGKLCTDVLYHEIFLRYNELPATLGPIAADIDPSWGGVPVGIALGKKIFELPQVEVGDHTFTHPFYWRFFEDYTPEKEEPFLSKYPGRSWKGGVLLKWFQQKKEGEKEVFADLPEGYVTPRAFALKPFSLELETVGSVPPINRLAPPDKTVQLYQWSGDANAFGAALALLQTINLPNINGGDSRFDNEYPSYTYVAPIGRKRGEYWQIYASCSNEFAYTDHWIGRFYGFRVLQQTLRNTECPFRIKPINIYYHNYSCERIDSLAALKSNIDFALSKKIIPIKASNFSKLARSFYSAKLEKLENSKWSVINRDLLQTVRFDRAIFQGIDFAASKGVVGQKHFQGSLYIYLDKKVDEPLIAIKALDSAAEEPKDEHPYLIDSRWAVYDLKRGDDKFQFITAGFGPSEMTWSIPKEGIWKVEVDGENPFEVGSVGNRLFLQIYHGLNEERAVRVEWVKEHV